MGVSFHTDHRCSNDWLSTPVRWVWWSLSCCQLSLTAVKRVQQCLEFEEGLYWSHSCSSYAVWSYPFDCDKHQHMLTHARNLPPPTPLNLLHRYNQFGTFSSGVCMFLCVSQWVPSRYYSLLLQSKDRHFQFIRFTGNSELSVKVMWNEGMSKESV